MAIGALIIGAVFVNNLILVQFLGICPFLGVSKKVESAFGMGMAVIFVMTVSSLISFALYQYVLVALGLEYLKTIVFIFVIAGLVQILEMALKKFAPALYRSMGVYLPLITTNCAILGVAELNIMGGYTLLTATLNGLFSGVYACNSFARGTARKAGQASHSQAAQGLSDNADYGLLYGDGFLRFQFRHARRLTWNR